MAPPKVLAKRERKFTLNKSIAVMITGAVALVLYVVLASVSGVFLGRAARSLDTGREAIALSLNCSSNGNLPIELTLSTLEHVIGDTVRLIFWTWLLIIYLLSIMIYIVYIIAAWQNSYSLGRGWCFVIVILTLLNFVPFSYIFTFGDINVQEKVTYLAMLAVILFFRIVDVIMMVILLREIRSKKALAEVRTMSAAPTANQSQLENPTGSNNIQVTPDPNNPSGGNPFEEGPQV